VKEQSKPHRPSIRLSILLAMLGICVFLWGYGYKLSLYNPHPANVHRVPEAKLLSKNEDPNATDSLRVYLSQAIFHPGYLIASAALIAFWLIGFHLSSSDSVIRTLDNPQAPSQQPKFLGAFFLRPPPIQFAL
jgi:hypothetical protein